MFFLQDPHRIYSKFKNNIGFIIGLKKKHSSVTTTKTVFFGECIRQMSNIQNLPFLGLGWVNLMTISD